MPLLPAFLAPGVHAQLKAAEERVIALKAAVLRGDLAVRQLLEAIVAH
jgi:hypothetical protein